MTGSEQAEPIPTGWADRVVFAGGPQPIAYARGQIVVPNTLAAQQVAGRLVNDFLPADEAPRDVIFEPLGQEELLRLRRRNPIAEFSRARDVPDPQLIVRELRSQGIDAQLNHVFFAHGCDCCGPHPSLAGGPGGVAGSPVYATPVYATPVYATPVYATPVYATPVYATGAEQATGQRRSSAVPATVDDAGTMANVLGLVPHSTNSTSSVDLGPIDVMVLDVGRAVDTYRPANLGPVDDMSEIVDVPDADGNGRLDPVAGHTEFIIGLIKSIAPSANVAARKVLAPEGDGDEVTIANAIALLPDVRSSQGAVLNLSFGGYVLDGGARLLGSAIRDAQARGWVVVASAGNDATCRPTYPAAFPDVVSVGAIGPYGPAPFTNYGPWVRACAPGVDLVSTFFRNFSADTEKGDFEGWARWSGTSFSAPIVAGAIIAWKLANPTSTVAQAAARIVDAPGLLRLRDLGTPVNMV